MPSPKASVLKLGHALDIIKRGPAAYFHDTLLADDAPLKLYRIGRKPLVVVRDPDLIAMVLTDKSGTFARDGSPVDRLLGGGLPTLTGDAWRTRRQLVAKPFGPDSIRRAAALTAAQTQVTIRQWRSERGSFDPMPSLAHLVLEVVTTFGFGVSLNPSRDRVVRLRQAQSTLAQDAMWRCFSPIRYWRLNSEKDLDIAQTHLRSHAHEIVTAGVERRARGRIERTLLDTLLDAEQRGSISRDAVLAEVLAFVVAALEPTTTALAWLLSVLSARPALRVEFAAKADAAQTMHGSTPTVDAVIRECLRLHPPLPMSLHCAPRGATLVGYPVPPGTRIGVLSLVTHRDPILWDRPETFDHTRFMEPQPVRPAGAYIPFLAGPHRCIGEHVAMLIVRVAATALCEALDFDQVGKAVPDVRVSLYPMGLRLRVRARAVVDPTSPLATASDPHEMGPATVRVSQDLHN